jgi:hypothetical protein
MMRVYIGLHFYAGKNLCFMFFYDVEYVDNNFNGELHKTLVTKRGAVPLDPVLRAMTRYFSATNLVTGQFIFKNRGEKCAVIKDWLIVIHSTMVQERKNSRRLIFVRIGFAACFALVLFNMGNRLKSIHDESQSQASTANIRLHILSSAQFLPPPFDTLLSDQNSPLFAKVMNNSNETMALVNSKVDVFTPLILQGVPAKNLTMEGESEKLWPNLTFFGNISGRAPIFGQEQMNYQPLFKWLRAKENTTTTQVPVVYSLHYNLNWGLFSTYFPEWRTTNWGYVTRDPRWKELVTDNPNFIALFSVQHHNMSDPELDNKILSLPTGSRIGNEIWDQLRNRPPDLLRDRDYDMTVAGSAYRFRIKVFCHFMNNNIFSSGGRSSFLVTKEGFMDVLSKTRYIWTPPGLGYDCSKNWDTMLAGAIPILERGVGLERTYAYLPSFWIDSHWNLTPEKLADAYPLFVALRNEFDFSRLSKDYWKNLVIHIASEKSDEVLRVKHPFPKQRVIWPYGFAPNEEGFAIDEIDQWQGLRLDYCNWTNISLTTLYRYKLL